MDPWSTAALTKALPTATTEVSATNARTATGPVTDLFQQQSTRLQALETAVTQIQEQQKQLGQNTDHKIAQVSEQLTHHIGNTQSGLDHLQREQASMTHSIAQALQKQDDRLARSMDELKALFLQTRGVKRTNHGEVEEDDSSQE